jgi:hypothetical protein
VQHAELPSLAAYRLPWPVVLQPHGQAEALREAGQQRAVSEADQRPFARPGGRGEAQFRPDSGRLAGAQG